MEKVIIYTSKKVWSCKESYRQMIIVYDSKYLFQSELIMIHQIQIVIDFFTCIWEQK